MHLRLGTVLLSSTLALAPACSTSDCGYEPQVPAQCVVVREGECPGQDVWRCTEADGRVHCLRDRGATETMCIGDGADAGTQDAR